MTDSKGWWYDRRKKKFISIVEHTDAVLSNPTRYGFSKNDPEIGLSEFNPTVRYKTIKRTCANGFIRVRLIRSRDKTTLGWQFTGEPHTAFEILKRFAKRHDVGPTTEVTFTDFGLGRTLTTFWSDFDTEKVPLSTLLEYWVNTRMSGLKKKVRKLYALNRP